MENKIYDAPNNAMGLVWCAYTNNFTMKCVFIWKMEMLWIHNVTHRVKSLEFERLYQIIMYNYYCSDFTCTSFSLKFKIYYLSFSNIQNPNKCAIRWWFKCGTVWTFCIESLRQNLFLYFVYKHIINWYHAPQNINN